MAQMPMDQRSSIAAMIRFAVQESLQNKRPVTMAFDLRTGVWSVRQPKPSSSFSIRRHLAGLKQVD